MAVADAGWRARGVAYGGAAILLRQHQAVRAGNGEHAGCAGACEEGGIGMGRVCRDGESEQPGTEVGAYGSRDEQNDGVGQRMQDGG